ncbi:S-layer homology domain-containing protein [Oscillospiraceae bacterium OttesenSCG-928-G22]|nr:S-layer homology domain-containing protein [Oscillospiraceae bacterium OttesenSCG-928-G22]
MANQKSKILSMLIAMAMVFTTLPMTAFAEVGIPLGDSGIPDNPATPTDVVLVALDELAEDILWQGYDYNTVTENELVLPDTLTGTDEDGNPFSVEGVTWECTSASTMLGDVLATVFDPETLAMYEFSPVLPEGCILAEGVTAPVISVFIRPEGGVKIQPMSSGSVIINNQTEWETFINATINSWNGDNNTITLNSDVSGNLVIPAAVTGLTIIGNGKTTAGSIEYHAIDNSTNSDLTIKNLNIVGGIGIAYYATGAHKLTIEGTCKITGTATSGGNAIGHNGSLTVDVTAGASLVATSNNDSVIYSTTDSLTVNIASGSSMEVYSNSSGKEAIYVGGNNNITITCNGGLAAVGGNSTSGGGYGISTSNTFTLSGTPEALYIIGGMGNSVRAKAINAGTFTNNTNITINGTTDTEIIYPAVSNTITAAAVNITAPITGQNSAVATANNIGYTVTSTAWKVTAGADLTTGNPFAASTAYTATVVLTAKTGYKFDTVLPGNVTGTNGTVISATTSGIGNNTLTVVVNYTATTATPTHSISLSEIGTYTFPAANVGYGELAPRTITITNTGNQATGNLTPALSGANAASFELSQTMVNSIAVGGTDTFTFRPKTGLSAGTYSATVTVSGGNGISASFNVNFTVNSIPTYAVTVSGGTGSGNYAQGATVSIAANGAPSGQQFKEWTVDSGGVTLANANSANTTFIMPANAVTVTATYENLPPNTYSITVQNDGNGTANANVNSATAGTTINLTVSASTGYQFKSWQVISGGVTIANNSFTMPAANVVVKAIFEPIPAATYTITFNPNGGSASETTRIITQGSAIGTLPNPTRSGSYSFNGWYTMASGGTKISAATIPTGNATYYAHWTDTSGNNSGDDSSSGSGSSSGGGGSSSTGTVTVKSDTDSPVTAVVTTTGTVDKNGNLSATVTDAMIQNAIARAQAEATRLGKTGDGIIIEIKITATGAKSLSVKMDAAALSGLNTARAGFSVTSEIFKFTLDDKAVKQVNTQSNGSVSFTTIPTDKLSSTAQAAIGSRPVYDFNLIDSTGKGITSYGNGTITRSINYTATSGERTGNLFAVKVLDNGNVQWITESSYVSGWLIWTGSSNSVYGVGYKASAPAFTDTTGHWANDNIDFVASRGLFSGTTATTFSPNTSITRGMFVTALGRLSGQDVSGYTSSSFTDVKDGSYYLAYIEWAVANKIVNGVENNQFAPDRSITREEMAVMIYNYAKATNYTLPDSRTAVKFTDDASISSWAKDAVKALQQAGVVAGVGAGNFNPKGTATRAEAATILRNFVEGIIDETTARGWAKNEAGQWMYWTWDGKLHTGWVTTTGNKYYMDANGIMVTGKWLQIGNKWYYFNVNGTLATNTTIDGYEVGADGARKE